MARPFKYFDSSCESVSLPSYQPNAFDTVRITGFPSTVQLQEIRNYFILRAGPCLCSYLPGYPLSIAIRFGSCAVAQQVVVKYNNGSINGYKIQVSLLPIQNTSTAWASWYNTAQPPFNPQALPYSVTNRSMQNMMGMPALPQYPYYANFGYPGYGTSLPVYQTYVSENLFQKEPYGQTTDMTNERQRTDPEESRFKETSMDESFCEESATEKQKGGSNEDWIAGDCVVTKMIQSDENSAENDEVHSRNSSDIFLGKTVGNSENLPSIKGVSPSCLSLEKQLLQLGERFKNIDSATTVVGNSENSGVSAKEEPSDEAFRDDSLLPASSSFSLSHAEHFLHHGEQFENSRISQDRFSCDAVVSENFENSENFRVSAKEKRLEKRRARHGCAKSGVGKNARKKGKREGGKGREKQEAAKSAGGVLTKTLRKAGWKYSSRSVGPGKETVTLEQAWKLDGDSRRGSVDTQCVARRNCQFKSVEDVSAATVLKTKKMKKLARQDSFQIVEDVSAATVLKTKKMKKLARQDSFQTVGDNSVACVQANKLEKVRRKSLKSVEDGSVETVRQAKKRKKARHDSSGGCNAHGSALILAQAKKVKKARQHTSRADDDASSNVTLAHGNEVEKVAAQVSPEAVNESANVKSGLVMKVEKARQDSSNATVDQAEKVGRTRRGYSRTVGEESSTVPEELKKKKFIKILEMTRQEIEQEYEREVSTLLGVVKTLASKDPSLNEKLKDVVRECLMDLGKHLVEKLEQFMHDVSFG